MSMIGNIVWLIFGGFLAALGYLLGGLVLCATIIGIPFGLQAFKLGIYALAPFGRELRSTPRGTGCLPTVFNLIWIVLFGWGIALTHVVFGILLTISVIGIPFGQQHFKLAMVAFMPFSFSLD